MSGRVRPHGLVKGVTGVNWPQNPKVLSMHMSITIKHILNTRVQLLL